MSVTQYIACQDCMDALWIGQRDNIYLGQPKTMKKMQDFLFKHKMHDLVFTDDNYITLDKNNNDALVDYWHELKKSEDEIQK